MTVVVAVAPVLDELVVLLVGVELVLAELAALVVELLVLELPQAASVSAHASTVGERRRLIPGRLAIATRDPARRQFRDPGARDGRYGCSVQSPSTAEHDATPNEHVPHPPPPGTHPRPRPRRRLDWELIACGFGGHVLVGLDAAEVGPQDALVVREQGSLRWHRCLRCDCWVALAKPKDPTEARVPTRDQIVVPLRGKALRDKVVLRLIAVDRAFHFTILVLLGLAVLLFASNETSLRDAYYKILTDIQGGVGGGPVQNTGHVGILHELDKLFSLRSGTLREVGIGLVAYGILEGVEAIGLWLTKRWAEYLTFIATTILLPLEIYEIIHRRSALKIIGFIINLAVVIYLLWAKRLFGLRGGGAADEAERRRAMSWETIEHATPAASTVIAEGSAPG